MTIPTDLMSIPESARSIPTRPHAATIWRWISRGVKGQRLPAYRIGGRTLVSRAELDSFLERLNHPTDRTPSANRQQAKREAEEFLSSQGL